MENLYAENNTATNVKNASHRKEKIFAKDIYFKRLFLIEDFAVIYVKECSACVFLQEIYSFWS